MSGEYSQDEEGYKKGAESVLQAVGAMSEMGQRRHTAESRSMAKAAEKLPSDKVDKAVDNKRWSWKKKAAVGAGVVAGIAALGLGIKYRGEIGAGVARIATEGGKKIGEVGANVSGKAGEIRTGLGRVAEQAGQKVGSAKDRVLGLFKRGGDSIPYGDWPHTKA